MRRARGARRRTPLAALNFFALAALLLAACTSAPPYEQRVHVVREGETLYAIAWQHRIDQRDLARWNGIVNLDLIHVGQRLRLTPPAASAAAQPKTTKSSAPSTRGGAPAGGAASAGSTRGAASAPKPKSAVQPALPNLPPPQWSWPVDGQVVARFGSHDAIGTGIGIAGRAGEPVHAAAAGRVVYAGSGLVGYGQLVIIKHNETYLTAYGYNSELLVKQGQDVTRGQTIASMGLGPERQPRLHFEIRRNGVPVDPLQFFPGR
ncbi:MAG TPA: peptidoglycan DD-metalloendopeptidase family protein [Gammaproteobacteria bacterium]|nr:peptidoglycan DD-metalloendopeptidase family protein [Gammaproteobacteria bacterium]